MGGTFEMKPSWEYIAAFFDGEGGFIVTYNHSGNPRIRIGLTQVDRSPLDEIQSVTGGVVHYNIPNKEKQPNQQPWHRLDITKPEEIMVFLKNIQPHVLRRQERIALAIAFFETLSNSGRPDLSNVEDLKRRMMHDKIFDLFMDKNECTKGRKSGRIRRGKI
jgi:hypothetical protein